MEDSEQRKVFIVIPITLAASETYLEGTSGDVCPMEGLLALFGGFGRPELGVAEVLTRKGVHVDQLAETTKRVLRAARKRNKYCVSARARVRTNRECGRADVLSNSLRLWERMIERKKGRK